MMNKKRYIPVFFLFFILVNTFVFTQWVKVIPINYYPIDSPGWSGPASAKMILDTPIIMADPSYVSKTQTELWTYISAHLSAAWSPLFPGVHTDPEAMQGCLREYDTRPGWTYNIKKTSTYDAIVSQQIVHTIAAYSVAPAVPIYGDLHWVAVYGVQTSSDPLPVGATYSIDWFQINDPLDPVLGVGKYIFYSGSYPEVWENGPTSVFLHIPTPDPFPNNLQKIAICDPDESGPLKIQARKPLPRRETVFNPNEAREAAINALKKYKLVERPGYRNAEREIRSGNPILVKRMVNRMPADYYIVPMVSSAKLTGAVLIDAYSGAILEASVSKKPVEYPYLSQTHKEAKDLLIEKIMRKEGIRSGDVTVEPPTLTWEHSLSASPFFPLWKTRATIKGVDKIQYLDFNQNIKELVNYPTNQKQREKM